MDVRPRILNDTAEFISAAEKWRTEDEFPVLPSASLTRYRDQSGGELPALDLTPLPGTVLSCGGPGTRALARLLAAATSRPHRHLDPTEVLGVLAELDGEYVTLVALPEEWDEVGDWPGGTGKVGILTARSLETMTAVVLRALTASSIKSVAPRRMAHPAMVGAETADVVGIDEIGEMADGRPGLLLLRGHGRECCVHLPDGVVCGRTDPPTKQPEDTTATRVPSCMQGIGCFRGDLSPEQRFPAHDLNATVAFLYACNSTAIGVNAFPHHVSVSLGMLEGTAVAVIGAVGQAMEDVRAEGAVAELVGSGMRLGDVVERLNHVGADRGGEMNRFALLGDAAVALPATDPQIPTTEAPIDLVEPEVMAALRHLLREVIPALELLAWLDCGIEEADLAALRKDARTAWADCASGRRGAARRLARSAADLAARADRLQATALTAFATTVHDTWWRFGGPAFEAFTQTSAAQESCRQCGRASARRLEYRHRLEERLLVTVGFCRRCGPTHWHAGLSGVQHSAPVDIRGRRGEMLEIPLTLANSGERAVAGAAAYCFVNGGHSNLPAPQTWDVALNPGESRDLAATVDLTQADLLLDVHEGVFVSILGGALTALPTQLTLVEGPEQ